MTKLDKSYVIQNIGVFLLILGYFGLPVSTFTVGAVLGFGALLYRWRFLHVRPDILKLPVWKPLLVIIFFIICLYISSIHGTDTTKSIEACLSQIHWLRPCFLLALLFNPRREYLFAVCSALTIGLLSILQGIFQGINPRDHRLYGGFMNANLFAAFINLLLPWVILGAVKYTHNKVLRFLAALIVAVGIGAVFLSGSRGALIAVAIVLFFEALLLGIKKKLLIALLIAIIVAAGTAYMHLSGLSRSYETAVGITSESIYQNASGRVYVWEGAWNMFCDHQAYGVGLYNFNANYVSQYMPENAVEPELEHAHNTILQRLAETGIVGSIGFWALILYQLAWLFRNRKINNKINYLSLACLASMLLGLIHGMVDYFFGLALYSRILWLQWSVTFCQSEFEKNETASDTGCNLKKVISLFKRGEKA